MLFHAAGDYSSQAGPYENTPSYVISSYTPTIKTLRYARERDARNAKSEKTKQKLLIATMPEIPDQDPLPGTTKEALSVRLAMEKTYAVKSLLSPSAGDVLNSLEVYDMVHLGCHGMPDPEAPSRGCLIFQKKADEDSSETVEDRPTEHQSSAIDLRRVRIAYLSACLTAENNGKKLATEAIHLASSFQVAVFADVIRSMLSTKDNVSIDVAKGLYEQLALEWNEGVVKALYVSLEKVRKRWPKQPLC